MPKLPTYDSIEITEAQLASFWKRFWNQIEKTEDCWLWIGAKTKAGYGVMYGAAHKPTIYAHRASFELHNGPIEKGKMICHKCDNPGCVNPDHFFLGTHLDNTRDMDKKGRRRSVCRLTPEQVREIRQNYVPWVISRSVLAKRYGVSVGCIDGILIGKSWKTLV
ncbi:MAG: HNH endonuclease [Opitutae bacterium]|nr:HNH endonuclease [Opitutae bacterium]